MSRNINQTAEEGERCYSYCQGKDFCEIVRDHKAGEEEGVKQSCASRYGGHPQAWACEECVRRCKQLLPAGVGVVYLLWAVAERSFTEGRKIYPLCMCVLCSGVKLPFTRAS